MCIYFSRIHTISLAELALNQKLLIHEYANMFENNELQ